MMQHRLKNLWIVIGIVSVFAFQTVSAQDQSVADYEPTGQQVEAFVNLNVRTGADTSFDSIGGITSGTQYAVLGQEGDWFIIDYDGQVGFVFAGFVRLSDTAETPVEPEQPEQPIPTEPTGEFVEAFVNLNVRTGAGTNHAVIGVILPGTAYAVFGQADGWYIIDFEGETGYISGAFVRLVDADETSTEPEQPEPEEPTEPEQPVPTEPTGEFVEAFVNLNVRAGAGTDHDVIGGITSGTRYAVLGQVDGWYIIDFEGETGYVSGAFVRVFDAEEATPTPDEDTTALTPIEGVTAVASVTVNVRTGAGTEYRIIGQILADEPYGVFGEEAGWVLIDYNGEVGYVLAELVTLSQQE